MALFSVWPNPRWWLGKFKWPYLHSGSYSSDSLHVWFCRGTVQCVTCLCVWFCHGTVQCVTCLCVWFCRGTVQCVTCLCVWFCRGTVQCVTCLCVWFCRGTVQCVTCLCVWFCRGTVQCLTVWLCTEQAKPNTTETLDSNTSGSCKWSSTLVFIMYYISWLKYNLYHIVIDGSTTAVPVDFHLPLVAVFIMHLMLYLSKAARVYSLFCIDVVQLFDTYVTSCPSYA